MTPDQNPLLSPWDTPGGIPPFGDLRAGHFGPAFDFALRDHLRELKDLGTSPEPPTFTNTIEAFDRSGETLNRVSAVFSNLCGSASDEGLRNVELEYAPRIAAQDARVHLDQSLFTRIDAVHRKRFTQGLTPVQVRLTEWIHQDFVLSGAQLDTKGKARLPELAAELAGLRTSFGQRVQADEDGAPLVFDDPAATAGLPESLVKAMVQAAVARGKPGCRVLPLTRSFVEPFLTHSPRRDLRKQVWEAFTARGERTVAGDTKPLIRKILALRNEQARIHGCRTYADFALRNRMARTPAAVSDLLNQVWPRAKDQAAGDRALLAALAGESGGPSQIEAWDWRYYAEQVRSRDFDLDEGDIRPYFTLDRMTEALFWVAGRLFGLEFRRMEDAPVYHGDVRTYEVTDRADGRIRGYFLQDPFTRPGKRSGAWMGHYRKQSAGVVPIVVNNTNFAPAAPGEPVFLGFGEVTTLFHEFGHGLHGLLSEVDYRRLSGTSVYRDYVEVPSQLFEHWALVPEVLGRFALHQETQAPLPPELADRIRQSRRFNQGWETVQYLGSALFDMELHSLPDLGGFDAGKFEKDALKRLGVPKEVGLRHRLPHFLHLFDGEAYAAGYYVYLWAEVIEADLFEAFTERGDVFDPGLSARLKQLVYSAGNSLDPAQAFRQFRGRDPETGALLHQRGLD